MPRNHDLVACVQSGAYLDENTCGQDDGPFDPDDGWCAMTVSSNMDNLRNAVGAATTRFYDGTWWYTRWFDIPFINDVDGEGYDQGDAVALAVGAIL